MAKQPRLSSYRTVLAAIGISNIGDGIALVAMPWLASAVTRSALLISVVTVVQRIPWLVFSLPAGVLTDRYDRRRLVVISDSVRAISAALLVVAVWSGSSGLTEQPTETNVRLYVVFLCVTLLLGLAEVVGDNASQTLMPSLVRPDQLEHANGRLWAVEQTTNTVVGPLIGSLLLAAAFPLPFAAQVVLFAVAAGVLARIGSRAPALRPTRDAGPSRFGAELREGVLWLWRHRVLRGMALGLSLTSAASAFGSSTYILYAREVMGIGPVLYAVVMLGGAIGAVIGGVATSAVVDRLGAPSALSASAGGLVVVSVCIGLFPYWPVVGLLSIVEFLCFTIWSVVTVSYRQRAIPDRLLGRVNSAYRWIGWGSIPVGAALGGWAVEASDGAIGRDWALRAVWFGAALLYAVVLVLTRTVIGDSMRSLPVPPDD